MSEIGIIPTDWHLKSLGEIASKIQTGPFGSQLHAYDYVFGGTPIINPSNLSNGKIFPDENNGVTDSKTKELSRHTLIEGDIVVGRRGEMGRTGYVTHFEQGWICGTGSLLVRLDAESVEPRFVNEIFKTDGIKNWLSLSSVGTTMENINAQIISKLPIPLPPTLTEQRAIATALSDVDQLLSALDQLIAKKKAIKQGAMQELLKPKSGWTPKNLGEIAEIVGGGTPSTFVPEYWNGTINWFTPTEIGTEKYLLESNRKITKEGLNNCSAKILPAGTVLLTTRAGIGDVGILTREGCTNQGFQSLIARDGYSNEFIYYLMHTLKSTLIQNASGSTFLEISPNKIKKIEVAIPDYIEQTAIAQILTDMDAEITVLERQREKYKAVKAGMMQELLTGKTRLI